MGIKRLKSLDALRGFTIAAMILVNNPGSWNHIYSPLKHAEWNGLTPTDLIFPFFLFIVGVSIALSYSKQILAGVPKRSLYFKILFRTIKIFTLGLFLDYINHFSLSELRIAGVLQRIAIVFMICSFLFLFTKWKTQIYIFSSILIAYWLTMCFIPVPGIGKISLEPGINIAAWIDRILLPGKMWQGNWDPEGIYSTLPAIATTTLGMLVGSVLLTAKTQEIKIIWIFILGVILSVMGYFWDLHFPINKSIWTSSYVLVTGGFACLLLAVSIYIVDVIKRKKIAQIGIVFGSNAIAAYVIASLLGYVFYSLPFGKIALNQHFMSLFLSGAPKLGSFIYAMMYVGINYIIMHLLYKKKIFIKL